MEKTFKSIFQGMPVLVTGHTGFKGSWLSIWLNELGAKVIGYSSDVPTIPSNFVASHLAQQIVDIRDDVRNLDGLCKTIQEYKPQVVFHLAAQAIVRESYAHPKETFDTNVGGTVNVLEAIRQTNSVRAAVLITTDKCYENREWIWGYREIDGLGGYDPYSASKAMAELAISAYRQSFFPPDKYSEHKVAIASTRAGNVIGGGDWAKDRILSDCVRALSASQPISIRNPNSVRPWQFVLEPLSGYLWLAVKLLEDGSSFAEAWNFGPSEQASTSVKELVQKLIELWGSGEWHDTGSGQTLHETNILRLNCEKAASRLGWRPTYAWKEALNETADWFKQYYANPSNADMYALAVQQIVKYLDRAREMGMVWTL
ncbi:MAG: CDP-glucose 4,6-dehydratase [Anaerolineales bacterium]